MTFSGLEAPKIGVFSDFLRFPAAEEWIAMKWMDMDQDNRKGTAIGFHASYEH